MNRRHRRLVFGALFLAPVVAIGAACTFPDVMYVAGDAATQQPGNETGADKDAEIQNDAPGIDLIDGSDGSAEPPEASVDRPDDVKVVDPGSCDGAPVCDCDNDGWRSLDCPDGAAFDAASTKPGDCDDLDPIRHPEAGPQPYVTDAGDWNCNGKVERDPVVYHCNPSTVLIKNVSEKCGGGTEGFPADNLPCGFVADIYTCPSDSHLLSEANCNAKPSGRRATVNCY